MCLISACKDNLPTAPSYKAVVFVDFDHSFQGDSVAVQLENSHRWGFRIDTTFLRGTTGLEYRETEGVHILSIELPLKKLHTTTLFIATEAYATEIQVHYYRAQTSFYVSLTRARYTWD